MPLQNDLIEWVTMDPTRAERPAKLIPIHLLRALLGERNRGQITALQASTALEAYATAKGYTDGPGLPAGVTTQLNGLLTALGNATVTAQEILDVLALNEAGLIYTTDAAVRTRFGL